MGLKARDQDPAHSAPAEFLCGAIQPDRPARMAGSIIIGSIEGAQHQATQWLWTYNHDRSQHGDR